MRGDLALALAIAKAVKAFDPGLILMGLYGSESIRAAPEAEGIQISPLK